MPPVRPEPYNVRSFRVVNRHDGLWWWQKTETTTLTWGLANLRALRYFFWVFAFARTQGKDFLSVFVLGDVVLHVAVPRTGHADTTAVVAFGVHDRMEWTQMLRKYGCRCG